MTMTRSAAEAVAAAKATTTNKPGMCQQVTRGWLGAGSAGDQDRDGDADAVDGWLSEPAQARHSDLANAPAGAPGAWAGGSGGFGHRALSVGGGYYRSTDAGGRGIVATRRWDWFERNWGLRPLGWSETISGQPIPGLKVQSEPKPSTRPAPKPTSRGARVDRAIAELRKARAPKGSIREAAIQAALSAALKIPFVK
jgi:hypothetical protein